MQKIVKFTLIIFVIITSFTALLTAFGLVYVWLSEKNSLPYLTHLVMAVLIEIAAVTFLLAKKGLKYLPETQTNKEKKDTLKFMGDFISSGTSATIISNRVSWLTDDQKLISVLNTMAKEGKNIEIITPRPVEKDIIKNLNGVTFIITEEQVPPKARFTLINGSRSGAERLAIARGVHPDHEITIFDNNSGPQIIAMAKDIIRKSKELAHASQVV